MLYSPAGSAPYPAEKLNGTFALISTCAWAGVAAIVTKATHATRAIAAYFFIVLLLFRDSLCSRHDSPSSSASRVPQLAHLVRILWTLNNCSPFSEICVRQMDSCGGAARLPPYQEYPTG